ncbi:secretory phospholipase A2 receptor-like [Leptodactylus fuscus]
MSALLLYITGLLYGILMPYTSAQLQEIRNGLWEENNVTHIYYQFNLQSALSWKEAQTACQDQGGDLLSITSLDEHNYISEKLGNADTMLWIGLNQLDGSLGWQWSDGAALAFVYSRINFPPWYHERGHCGTYHAGEEHKWKSSGCEQELPYACKKYLKPRQHELYENWKYYPIQCESGWIPYNQRCTKLLKEESSWSAASGACRIVEGELMSVNSLADVEFLFHLLNDENISEAWIGLSSELRAPLVFQWSDNSAVTFTSWQRNEPDISLESTDLCVSAQRDDGNWKVRPCSRKLFYVCKKPGVSETVENTNEEKCAQDWVRHGNYCYGTVLQDRTFLQVVGDSGCPPAIITNRFEQAFLNSLISSKIIPVDSYFWIALQDINKTGEYSWLVHGSEYRDVSFTNWDTEEPSHNEGCVALSTGLHKGRWKVKDCEGFSAKSLCKKPLRDDMELHVNPDKGNTDKECHPSWESHRHYCYKVFHGEKLARKRTWQEAEDLCQDLGAHLVSLSNVEEKKFVEDLLFTMFNGDAKRKFWIGFNKRSPSSKESWEWSDGSPVVTSLWRDVYPKDTMKNCAAYTADKWLMPIYCNEQEEWICKIPKGVAPKVPDWLFEDIPWYFFQGNDYSFITVNADFDVAQHVCYMKGSTLTSVHSEAEQAFLYRKIKQMSTSNMRWWIGLEKKEDGVLSWRDESSLIYSNWKTDPQGNNSSTMKDRQCAYMDSNTGLWSYTHCQSEHLSICKADAIMKIENHYPPVVNDHYYQAMENCPGHWLYYGNKYILVCGDKTMDWYAASNFCREYGGDLATVTNEIEQAFIVMQLLLWPEGFWLGLTDTDYELWENGSVQTYNNWTPTRHSHNGENDQHQLCALIAANYNGHQTGKWYLEKCSARYGFICEKRQDSPTPGINITDMFPVSETMMYGHKTYRIISGHMSWHDASTACQQYGDNLVSITDESHQAFVTILVHRLGYSHWIGSYSANARDDFKWIDGSLSLFASWADDESPSNESCVYIDTSGYWRAEDCDTPLKGALCLPSTGSKILTVETEEEDKFIHASTLSSLQSIWLNRMTFHDGIQTSNFDPFDTDPYTNQETQKKQTRSSTEYPNQKPRSFRECKVKAKSVSKQISSKPTKVAKNTATQQICTELRNLTSIQTSDYDPFDPFDTDPYTSIQTSHFDTDPYTNQETQKKETRSSTEYPTQKPRSFRECKVKAKSVSKQISSKPTKVTKNTATQQICTELRNLTSVRTPYFDTDTYTNQETQKKQTRSSTEYPNQKPRSFRECKVKAKSVSKQISSKLTKVTKNTATQQICTELRNLTSVRTPYFDTDTYTNQETQKKQTRSSTEYPNQKPRSFRECKVKAKSVSKQISSKLTKVTKNTATQQICTELRNLTRTNHFLIPTVVLSIVAVSILLIVLLIRKRFLARPNLQRLSCTQARSEPQDEELCISIADLDSSSSL